MWRVGSRTKTLSALVGLAAAASAGTAALAARRTPSRDPGSEPGDVSNREVIQGHAEPDGPGTPGPIVHPCPVDDGRSVTLFLAGPPGDGTYGQYGYVVSMQVAAEEYLGNPVRDYMANVIRATEQMRESCEAAGTED